MFRPNTTCMLSRAGTKRTLFGKSTMQPPVRVPCSIVSLSSMAAKSSVRADSSASHAAAEEMQADAKLLFPASVAIAHGDIVEVQGVRLKIASIQPRIALGGKLDHNEVVLVIQAAG